MKLAGHVALVGQRKGPFRDFLGKPDRKSRLGDLGVEGRAMFKLTLLTLTNKKPTRCHLLLLFYFLETQHVSSINMSIFRSLRLCCWTTTLAVSFFIFCVLELRCGSAGVVSRLPAEVVLQPAARIHLVGFLFVRYHNDARSNKHQTYRTQLRWRGTGLIRIGLFPSRCVHITNLLKWTVFTQHTNNSCKSQLVN